MLPTFFIIGAQKCATSSLYRALQQHPQVYLSPLKEPDYFTRTDTGGQHDRAWYERLFDAAGQARAVGEASTSYTMFPQYPGVPDRLLAAVPEPKLIYLMRDPVQRMRSAYQHALATGYEHRDIRTALLQESAYLLTSSYALQLDQWLARVPAGSILLLSAEDWRRDPATGWRQVTEFLAVDPIHVPPGATEQVHASATKRAPRGWWRRFGHQVVTHGWTDRLPTPVLDLSRRQSPLVTRQITTAEVTVDAELDGLLRRALRPDLLRLAERFPPAKAWLDAQL